MVTAEGEISLDKAGQDVLYNIDRRPRTALGPHHNEKIVNTIDQTERNLESEIFRLMTTPTSFLHSLIPHDYQPRVSLHDASGRKKRRDASMECWSAQSGEIRICFAPSPGQLPREREADAVEVPAADPPGPLASAGGPPPRASAPGSSGALAQLVRALDRTEARPGLQFVALKWFRSNVLDREGFSESEGQEVLERAIDARLVLTSKVPNPGKPQFPVTAIRLNRVHPQVHAILGQTPAVEDDFDPVAIPGEELSATVHRERR